MYYTISSFNFREYYSLIRFFYNHATKIVFLVANTDSLQSIMGGSAILGL